MKREEFKKLVDQIRGDPKLFHAIVFDPESVLSKLDFLDRKSKGALVALDPEQLIGRIIGELAGCDVTCTSSCGVTCNESCGYTTNIAHRLGGGGVSWCDITCTSSCGATCTGSSCGYTTNLQGPERFGLPFRAYY